MKIDFLYHTIVSCFLALSTLSILKYEFNLTDKRALCIAMILTLGIGICKERLYDSFADPIDYEGNILGCAIGLVVGTLL